VHNIVADCAQIDVFAAAAAGDAAAAAVSKVAPTAINVMSGKSYEQEFDLEVQRMAVRRRCVCVVLG
jgi:hypothetical protein